MASDVAPAERMVVEETAPEPSTRATMVGEMGSDVRPAKAVGMRAIWLLRGESPPAPTVEQLIEPDAVVTSFSGIPNALAGMADARVPAGLR